MNTQAEATKRRTRAFAIAVIRLVRTFPRTLDGEIVGRQLIKASTGAAANYRAACRARSHAEFTAKIGVVLEEADESEFWLDVVREMDLSNSDQASQLHEESRELMAMFSAANITARQRS